MQKILPILLKNSRMAACLLFLAVVIAYLPAYKARFIWDDDSYVINNPQVTSDKGFARIWFSPKSSAQYYPMVFSSFRLEHGLWGLWPMGYHITNVLLHALCALLFWRVLAVLKVPGAAWAAFLFALHPVCVESVAWITERKNVLSGAFYMASALFMLRFFGLDEAPEHRRRARAWILGFLLFACALASKTVAASLPAALILVLWWKRGRVAARDLLALAPFFVLGIAMGSVTAWLERVHVGAMGAEWDLPFVSRLLVAGRALCFYAAKLVWPADLVFNYPRWNPNPAQWPQYLFPAAVLVCLAALWMARRRTGLGPLIAALFFCGTLFPALGFFNVFPHRYSFVADHFQYLACTGLLALGASAATLAVRRLGPKTRALAAGAGVLLLLILGVKTFEQCRMYENIEILWRHTLEKNPASWMAHHNLAAILQLTGRRDEAIRHYRTALAIKEDQPLTHFNLAMIYKELGMGDKAVEHFLKTRGIKVPLAQVQFETGSFFQEKNMLPLAAEHLAKAVDLEPDWPEALYKLACVRDATGNQAEAVRLFTQAILIRPRFGEAQHGLGLVLLKQGDLNKAAIHLWQAAILLTTSAPAQNHLAQVLARLGQPEDAVNHFKKALQIQPTYAEAHKDLGHVLIGQGKTAEAMAHYLEAVRIVPDDAETHYNLGVLYFAQKNHEAARDHFEKAVRSDPASAEARMGLGLEWELLGEWEKARGQFKEALRLKPDFAEARQHLARVGKM